jgi:hypothetical protein
MQNRWSGVECAQGAHFREKCQQAASLHSAAILHLLVCYLSYPARWMDNSHAVSDCPPRDSDNVSLFQLCVDTLNIHHLNPIFMNE